MPNIDECAAPVLPTVCRVCPLASTVCAYTWAAVYRRGHSALSCANASRIREGFSRAHALDMSLIIPGTRWPAGSPSHIGARAPPALRGRALFKRWFNKRVLHVPRLQVWDFARPRRCRNIRRAPQRCVGMRHPSAGVTAIFLLLHPVIKRIRTNVPGNIWRPSPSKGKVIMGRFCSYERQQQKRRSQSSYL